MKIKSLAQVVLLAFAFAGVASGQLPSSSSARNTSTEIPVTDERVDQVIKRANDHFRKGKLNLEDNKREQARDEFDKAIDEILVSGLDVRASHRLQTGYLELVEKIYREEVPLIRSTSQQDVKSASQNQIGFRQQPLRPSSLNQPSKSVSTENATLKAEQEPCTLGIEKAPMFRGLKLGMTISQVKALYPSISEPKERDELGETNVYIPRRDAAEKLEGIDSIFLSFIDGRVYVIIATYAQDYGQEPLEIAKSLGLPNEDYANAQCAGFSVDIFHQLDKTYKILLTDIGAATKKIARSTELEENSADCQRILMVRGIRLGMAVTKFRTLYPRSREVSKRSEVGESVFYVVSTGDPRLNGISNLWAYFLDGVVYFFVIDYTGQIQWKGIDQFVEQFSKGLGLRTKWEGSERRTLRCHSFVVSAEMKAGHPRIMIQNKDAVIKLGKREERSKSPASFRP